MHRASLVIFLTLALSAKQAHALDFVTRTNGGKTVELAGRIEVEAEDGGVLLLTRDGTLWPLPKEEIAGRRKDEAPFEPLDREQLAKQVVSELPAGFKVHSTKHYLICYNTTDAYAQWVGALYERLFTAFYNYWEQRGMQLHEPQFPLVALVFDTRESFALFARGEVGEAAGSMIGYYSLRTNRMVSYDLTGAAGVPAARIIAILSQPGAERTVATIVHEATHQLAFNSGLQVRYADLPFWVSEGIAIYFESPDLTSAKGWRGIGRVNAVNLTNFRKLAANKPPDLTTLLTDDKRFRDGATSAEAYAQSWALTYFLIRTRGEAFAKYLQALGQYPPLGEVTADERIAEFKRAFGDDLPGLEVEFLRYMRRVQ
ncbi:MAG: DUF1570 domain-containing protein [Planctomycetaceae bacterium]|nr:DUF1570 domain-containing protein [Planctomycetaceae bacterium]